MPRAFPAALVYSSTNVPFPLWRFDRLGSFAKGILHEQVNFLAHLPKMNLTGSSSGHEDDPQSLGHVLVAQSRLERFTEASSDPVSQDRRAETTTRNDPVSDSWLLLRKKKCATPHPW